MERLMPLLSEKDRRIENTTSTCGVLPELVVVPRPRIQRPRADSSAFLGPSQLLDQRIAVRSQGRIFLIDPHDVIAVRAQNNYVILQRHDDAPSIRGSISVVAEKLKPYGFIRIHRSVLVNGFHVQEIQALPTGEYLLRLAGKREYTATRTYKNALRGLAGLWIGVDTFGGEP